MIFSCKPKCKLSDGKTTGKLDLESNEVICDRCQDVLPGISQFSKKSLKDVGEVIKKRKVEKAFSFHCNACDKTVEAIIKDGVVCGKDCTTGECNIKISKMMVQTLPQHSAVEGDSPTEDEDTEE